MAPTEKSSGRSAVRLAAAAVALLVCLVYLPVLGNGFVNWDDDVYVSRNPLVTAGDLSALPGAFTSLHASGNWHPLTTLSHKADHAIWGLWPVGHHLTSILLHGLDAGLVVLLACALLGARARSLVGHEVSRPGTLVTGIAAGLVWGLHPLRVESVAWVSERKDVLCALFYLLGVLGYLRYGVTAKASENTAHAFKDRFYLGAVACLALALLSKPMAMSLPLVLLVLDAYPLGRMRRNNIGRVLLEKLPFVFLALASALVALHAQRMAGAMRALAGFPLQSRLLVAVQSTVGYLGKTLWPSHLRALYSYPREVSLTSWQFAVPLLALVLILVVCARLAHRHGAPAAAMAGYLAMLLPVAGIVQVGPQAMADRYTYLPGVALSLLAGAALGSLWEAAASSPRRWPTAMASLLMFLAFAGMSWLSIRQMAVWRDGESLWSQVLVHEPWNTEAHNSRASFYYERGEFDKALADYSGALGFSAAPNPAHATKRRAAILNDRAVTYVQMGRLLEAVADESEAIRLRPGSADYHSNRAKMFQRMGRADEAAADSEQAQALRLRAKDRSVR
jgi:tetratricopeptide (TPR) repeat protein